MSDQGDPATMLSHAEDVQAQMRRRGRWYPAWVTVFGLISVGVVAAVPVARGWWGLLFTAALMAWIVGLQRWKARQSVHPVADQQMLLRWMVPWGVLYLLAISWVGPRWLGQHVGWWALLGVVVALPAFLDAARSMLRSRQRS